ncbi:MAG: hypothetical protein U0354_11520 [Candidatus Sericytochromatia bacterium]
MSTGKCNFCNEEFTKRTIKNHLNKCKSKEEFYKDVKETEKSILLLIQDKYSKEYWMYVEVLETTTLSQIDKFLRDVWLECCGHMSAFYLKNNEIAKSKKISSFMLENLEMDYEYDFGSTTSLTIKILSISTTNGKQKIQIDAINNLPYIKCSFCEENAEFICPFCYDDNTMCKKHLKKHSCVETEGEECMASVTNSPRMGVCGYEGTEEKILKKYFPKK